MRNKTLSSAITLFIGVFILVAATKNWLSLFPLNHEEQIAVGIFFAALGFLHLFRQIFKIEETAFFYIGTVAGALLVTAGLLFLYRASSIGLFIIAPGLLVFLGSFISLLGKKFPEQKDKSFILTSKEKEDL